MPRPHPARDPRAARLEARLALYAQYAALVGDEVAAAWSGVPAQAGALTRELAAERRLIAERYAELGDWAEQGAPLTPDAFGTVLAGAVTELDHQAEVNRALRDRLESLQASGWIPTGGDSAVRALPPGAPVDSTAAPRDVAESVPADEPARGVPHEMGGALVAARSSGVGGVLGGRYPGVVAGADATDYVTGAAEGEGTAAARVDVRL